MTTKQDAQQWTLYVLKLEEGKWFVDSTSGTPEIQLQIHKSGNGTPWTRRYTPVKISFTKKLGDISEDKAIEYTGKLQRKYMEHYGDGNVRGGDLPDIEQPAAQSRFFSMANQRQLIIIGLLTLAVLYLLADKFLF